MYVDTRTHVNDES